MTSTAKRSAPEPGHASSSSEAAIDEALNGAHKRVEVYNVPPPDLRTLYIPLEGASPLVCHRFSEKARKAILDAQTGKASAGREPKDPQRDYEQSLYPHPDPQPGAAYGFRAVAFKNAMVRAGTYLDMHMTYTRGCFHIKGEGPDGLVRIEGEPTMREDPVRLPRGVLDLRYRGAFWPWRVLLEVRYNARAISADQVINLAQHAGFSVGVGEGRPEKDGDWGMFGIAQAGAASASQDAA